QLCGAGEEVAIALLLRSFQWEGLLKEDSSSASVALRSFLSTVDGWSIIRGAPVPDSGWARRLVRWQHSVMPGEPCQGELQDDLARTLRPARRLLGFLQTLQVAADVNEDAGQLRPHGFECHPHSLSRRDDVILKLDACSRGGSTLPAARVCGIPGGGDLRGHLGEPEVRSQTLARGELFFRDERFSVLVAATAKPGQRAFRIVDRRG